MQIRYLASVSGVHCAVPLRDQLSNLITHTQYIADRNIYAAILDRQQWNKLREEFWATGRQCDHGRLVPDIDFIASDGKVFLDFEACRKHEAAITDEGVDEGDVVGQIKRLWKTVPDEYRIKFLLHTERSEFIAAKICADVVQYNNGEFCNAATEHRFQEWLVSKSQCGQKVKSSGSYPEEAGSIPATATTFLHDIAKFFDLQKSRENTTDQSKQAEFLQELTDLVQPYLRGEKEAWPKHLSYWVRTLAPNVLNEKFTSSWTPATIPERLDTPEKLDAEIERVNTQIKHLEAVTPPQTLEDRMLVVVGSNYMALSLVASLLKVDESAVRAVAMSSGKFKLSVTGKSITKKDA